MRQIWMATLAYAEDNQRFPPAPRLLAKHSLEEGRPALAITRDTYSSDDWHARIWLSYISGDEFGGKTVFICPVTRSLYSYDFNPKLYGTPLQQVSPGTAIESETGYGSGSSPPPHRYGYLVNYCKVVSEPSFRSEGIELE